MKHYEIPKIECIKIQLTDVITASSFSEDDTPVDQVPGGGNEGW